jgi:FKBP-type peptidyl-prolyl cis-trans isomerase
MKKNLLIALIIIILILVAGAVYLLLQNSKNTKIESSLTANVSGQSQQNSMSFDIQGMKVDVLQQGNGNEAKADDKVTVNYVGTLQNGTKFDSSIDRGQPFTFTLGQNSVIQGWELGVTGMKVGEKRKLTIPPELAYGNQAVGGVIPANSTLVFEVEMLGINQK